MNYLTRVARRLGIGQYPAPAQAQAILSKSLVSFVVLWVVDCLSFGARVFLPDWHLVVRWDSGRLCVWVRGVGCVGWVGWGGPENLWAQEVRKRDKHSV